MIDQHIAKAAKYVEHAACQPQYKDNDGFWYPPHHEEFEQAGVYVYVVHGRIHAMASNGFSLAKCLMITEEIIVKQVFVPLHKEANENKILYDKYLRMMLSLDDQYVEAMMLKETLIAACSKKPIVIISFDNETSIKVPTKDIVNFCNQLPNGSKITAEVIRQEIIHRERPLLKLSCDLSDKLHIEQITMSLE